VGVTDPPVYDGGIVPPASCALPIASADHAARLATLGTALDGVATSFEKSHDSGGAGTIDCPAPGTTPGWATSDWGRYALVKLARGTDATGQAMAQSAIKCLFTYQDTKAGSATAGVFRSHINAAPLASDNSTEFALEPVAWLLSRKLLPASMLTTYAGQIQSGLDAIDAHDVCPGYTNVCLLQQAIRLAIGSAFIASSDATLKTDGAARIAKAKSELDAWAATVKQGGLHEYQSPTYAEIDLEALNLAHQGAVAAKDATAQARVDGAIDYLWSTIAANVFASRSTLSPPYSRTYDFAGGAGVLEYAIWLEGLSGQPWQDATGTMAGWLFSDEPTAHRPPASALCLSALPTREVVSEWQQDGHTVDGRYAFLTPDFTLGGATADYPVASNIRLDAVIGGSLVSTPKTPMVNVIPDWLDSPLEPIAAGNYTKPTHLALDPAIVQQRGDLLALLRVPAADPSYGTSLVNLTTNLVAPAKVDSVRVDGVVIDPTKTGKASPKPVLVVQNGTGVLAVTVLDVSGLDCVTSTGAIKESGAAHVDVLPLPVQDEDAAVRLAIRHLDAPPSSTSSLDACFARVALMMNARTCDGAGCGANLSAAVTAAAGAAKSSFDLKTGAWDVSVQAPGGPRLHVARPTASAGQVTATDVNGVKPAYVPFSVNGVGIPLLP
jgi:hypothetical protein